MELKRVMVLKTKNEIEEVELKRKIQNVSGAFGEMQTQTQLNQRVLCRVGTCCTTH